MLKKIDKKKIRRLKIRLKKLIKGKHGTNDSEEVIKARRSLRKMRMYEL